MATKSSKKSGTEFTQATQAAKFILSKTKLRPKIALVLGSGLGGFADEFTKATRIPYKKIPHFPQSTAIGHAGRLVIGNVGDVPVVGMQGRVHLYEGYSAQQVAFPIRVFQRAGVKALIVTNAAGGINLSYSRGALVVLRDHINHQAANPLIGPNDDRFGPRFPDMTHAYDPEFRRFVAEEGKRLKLTFTKACILLCAALITKRLRKSTPSGRSVRTWSACPPFPRFLPHATATSACSASLASPIWLLG